MERRGFLHVLIAVFTAIGTLFTGGRGAPSAEVDSVSIMVEPRQEGRSEKELDAAVEVLRKRFPEAKVSRSAYIDEIEIDLRAPIDPLLRPAILIEGKLNGTDQELSDLATMTGGIMMLLVAGEQDAQELGVNLAEERARVEAFLSADKARTIGDYNALPKTEGGSPAGIVFALAEEETLPVALRLEANPKWQFDERSLGKTYVTRDPRDHPALGFDVATSRQADFEAFTTHSVGRQLAIVGDEKQGQRVPRPQVVDRRLHQLHI